MSINPVQTLEDLDSLVGQLADVTERLSAVEAELEPVQMEYDEFLSAFEEGLWSEYNTGSLRKWPAEGLRVRMAHRAMAPQQLGRWVGLTNRRKRLMREEASLQSQIGAKRSILSALKTDAEVTQTGFRRPHAVR